VSVVLVGLQLVLTLRDQQASESSGARQVVRFNAFAGYDTLKRRADAIQWTGSR
jgi:hypothetical protein